MQSGVLFGWEPLGRLGERGEEVEGAGMGTREGVEEFGVTGMGP